MNAHEQSLLLYLETCLVEHGGAVCGPRLNADDLALTRRWMASGLIEFRRVPLEHLRKQRSASRPVTHTVHFTDAAWTLAHQFRRERAARLEGQRLREDTP